MSLGLMFPGQGSQKVGMIGDLLAAFPVVRQTLEEADDALGFRLSALMLEGPEDALGRTENTQPAMLTASVACVRALVSQVDVRPVCMAGHSLGEYSALVFAESLRFADALRLVRLRATAMQSAVPEGEGLMAAVLGLDDQVIESVCASVDGIVEPANYNAPGQVVVAGERQAVLSAIDAAKAAGARRAMPLPVSVPAHSSLMTPAAVVLGEALEGIDLKLPGTEVIHNVEPRKASDLADLSRLLVRQLAEPVRFVEGVRAMRERQVARMIECGPGGVLSGLVRRIDRDIEVLSCGTLEALEKTLQALAS